MITGGPFDSDHGKTPLSRSPCTHPHAVEIVPVHSHSYLFSRMFVYSFLGVTKFSPDGVFDDSLEFFRDLSFQPFMNL